MRKVIELALNDLRIFFRDKGVWVELIVIPIVLSVVVGFASGAGNIFGGGTDAPDLIVDVIDNDTSALSAQFLDEIRAANEHIVLCPMDNNADDVCGLGGAALTAELAAQRLEEQDALALVEIPAGFTAALNGGEKAAIIYRANENLTAPSYLLQAVRAAAQRVSGALVTAQVGGDLILDFAPRHVEDADTLRTTLYERASALWAQDPVRVEFVQATTPQSESVNIGGFGQSVPGMSSMYVMFAVLPMMAAYFNERKNWTMQRLMMMPLSRAQILGGRLLARFTIGMIEYGIIFTFGFLLGVRYGSDPLALVLVMIAFTLCITALALVLTTIVNNEAQARGIALFLTLTLAPLGGSWWPLEIVPEWMRTLGHISPIAWAMDAYHSLMFFGGNLVTVLPQLGVLLVAAAVLFAIGIMRFKYD